jgi:hypothetical protein
VLLDRVKVKIRLTGKGRISIKLKVQLNPNPNPNPNVQKTNAKAHKAATTERISTQAPNPTHGRFNGSIQSRRAKAKLRRYRHRHTRRSLERLE